MSLRPEELSQQSTEGMSLEQLMQYAPTNLQHDWVKQETGHGELLYLRKGTDVHGRENQSRIQLEPANHIISRTDEVTVPFTDSDAVVKALLADSPSDCQRDTITSRNRTEIHFVNELSWTYFTFEKEYEASDSHRELWPLSFTSWVEVKSTVKRNLLGGVRTVSYVGLFIPTQSQFEDMEAHYYTVGYYDHEATINGKSYKIYEHPLDDKNNTMPMIEKRLSELYGIQHPWDGRLGKSLAVRFSSEILEALKAPAVELQAS